MDIDKRSRPENRGGRFGRRFPGAVVAIALFSGFVFSGGVTFAQQTTNYGAEPSGRALNAFQSFELYNLQLGALLLVRNGRLKEAVRQIRRAIDRFPQVPDNHYLLAAVLAKQSKSTAAFDRLTIAVRRGFANMELIQSDPSFKLLRKQQRWQSLIAMIAANAGKAGGAKKSISSKRPSTVTKGGTALVNEDNTVWDAKLKILHSSVRFGSENAAPAEVQLGKGALQQLNEWYSGGTAAGNTGDLYDNHDRNHSSLRPAEFPQLTFVKYGSSARQAGVDYGLNTSMFFNAITIGNSSTVENGRSQARNALTMPGIPGILYRQYVNNQLYVYPEHRDYDPERGDLLPANTPYMIVSQGSSGSDRPFLRAVASILAAFKPEVKKFLRQRRLVMPTVQMIFRRGQKTVTSDADYLSAKAHPPVFKSENIDLSKMIGLANRLNIEDIPPMIGLQIVEESGAEQGIDDFTAGISETLFNTPGAIARVVRFTAYEKRMVVRVRNTTINDKVKLNYHWVVLRGDRDRIKIIRRDLTGSEAELIIPWHGRFAVPGQPGMTTDRVEIGVFVDNGKYYSAPAFINLLYPPHQKRKYNEKRRVESIDHRDPEFAKRYMERRLFSNRDWVDTYRYDMNSGLIGWQRKRGKWLGNYTRDGAKVVAWDDQDRATEAKTVGYRVEPAKRGGTKVVEFSTGKLLSYRYRGEKDLIGKVSKEQN